MAGKVSRARISTMVTKDHMEQLPRKPRTLSLVTLDDRNLRNGSVSGDDRGTTKLHSQKPKGQVPQPMKSKIPRRSKDKENSNPNNSGPEKCSPKSSVSEKSVRSAKVKITKDLKPEVKTRTKVFEDDIAKNEVSNIKSEDGDESVVIPGDDVITQNKDTEEDLLPEGVINIDLEAGLYEYAGDVIVYLRKQEKVYQLKQDFLVGGETRPDMRAMLVDWLIQVQHHLSLCQETLYLSIIMLDTVLCKRDITSEKLQLVGVTCLLLASKLEEYYPADIRKLIHLTSDSYTCRQILRMELVIIEILDFQLYFPESMSFLGRFCRAALRGNDVKFIKTCQYLIDRLIVDESFSTILPSTKAAASIMVSSLLYSLQVNQESPCPGVVWTQTLEHYTSYTLKDLVHTGTLMLSSQQESCYTGAKMKYTSNSKHQRIALAEHLSPATIKRAIAWLGAISS